MKALFDTDLNKGNVQMRDFVLDKIGPVKRLNGLNALEVGIGNGRFGILLGRHFNKYFGIDTDRDYLEAAKKTIPADATFIYEYGNAEWIPFNEKVDVILYPFVWHFIRDFGSALSEANRLLKKNGLIFILEPSEKTKKWADDRLNRDSDKFDEARLLKKIEAIDVAKKALESQDVFEIKESGFVDCLGSSYYVLGRKN